MDILRFLSRWIILLSLILVAVACSQTSPPPRTSITPINQDDPTITPILNPLDLGNSPEVRQNKDWGSYLYIPKADCYYLEATWPGGS